jgi:hypothetical protein
VTINHRDVSAGPVVLVEIINGAPVVECRRDAVEPLDHQPYYRLARIPAVSTQLVRLSFPTLDVVDEEVNVPGGTRGSLSGSAGPWSAGDSGDVFARCSRCLYTNFSHRY